MTRDPQIETTSSSLLRRVIEIVAPQLPRLDDCTLERFVELSGDVWIAAALLFQRETYLHSAGSENYIETMLRNRGDDLTPADARGYVEYCLSKRGESFGSIPPGADGSAGMVLDN